MGLFKPTDVDTSPRNPHFYHRSLDFQFTNFLVSFAGHIDTWNVRDEMCQRNPLESLNQLSPIVMILPLFIFEIKNPAKKERKDRGTWWV